MHIFSSKADKEQIPKLINNCMNCSFHNSNPQTEKKILCPKLLYVVIFQFSLLKEKPLVSLQMLP